MATIEKNQQATGVRIGIITDTQHADIDDMIGYSGRKRRYRGVLRTIERAGKDCTKYACRTIVDLGDCIDRRGHHHVADLNRVEKMWQSSFVGRRLHLIGNHDLTALPRKTLLDFAARARGMSSSERTYKETYFVERVNRQYWLVCLDTYDLALSKHAWPEDHPKRRAALRMHAAGVERGALECRGHPELNGGVSNEQLVWLHKHLEACRTAGERCVVFSHAPFFRDVVAFGDALCWNSRSVMRLLHRYVPDVVSMVVSGHDHVGSTKVDTAGLRHVVLPAALESEPGQEAFAVLVLREDGVELHGKGLCRSVSCKVCFAAVGSRGRCSTGDRDQEK